MIKSNDGHRSTQVREFREITNDNKPNRMTELKKGHPDMSRVKTVNWSKQEERMTALNNVNGRIVE